MKQHMLTHKIRDMSEHVSQNSVTQLSPSSDSNNSSSTLSGSQMNKLNRLQQSTVSPSQSKRGTVISHKFDDTPNSVHSWRQLNASHKKYNSDFGKSVGSVTTEDQRNTVYLSSDDSVSMSSSNQQSKSHEIQIKFPAGVDDECESNASSSCEISHQYPYQLSKQF